MLITLSKLKLGLNEEFIGHLFGVSTSLVSFILSTYLPLLHYELQPLVYWPEAGHPAEVLKCSKVTKAETASSAVTVRHSEGPPFRRSATPKVLSAIPK